MVVIVEVIKEGRKYKVLVPSDAPESTWNMGIIIGPPDLSELGLPPMIEKRLHDELYNRGMIQESDIQDIKQVQAALNAALKVDVNLVLGAYRARRT